MIVASMIGLLAALTFPEPLDPSLDWHDCSQSPMLEGRGFPGEGNPYHRLPESQKPRTTEKVWGLSQTSIGFNVRFKTDSDTLAVRWDFPGFHSPLAYMSMVAHVGVDIYARGPNDKEWRHVNGGVAPSWRLVKNAKSGEHTFAGELQWKWKPGDEAMVYLPMRFGPRNFAIGLKKGATFEKARPHIADKPVVIYGTSICNGGSTSRAGLAFPAIMGRIADVEVVNLGFSGAGCMELPMADLVADIDASIYILDCLPNMNTKLVDENYEPFLRQLRKRRPDVPIIMCGKCTIMDHPNNSEQNMLKIRSRLEKEEPELVKNTYYIPGYTMLPHTDDCLADNIHPNDWGHNQMGRLYAKKILEVLGK